MRETEDPHWNKFRNRLLVAIAIITAVCIGLCSCTWRHYPSAEEIQFYYSDIDYQQKEKFYQDHVSTVYYLEINGCLFTLMTSNSKSIEDYKKKYPDAYLVKKYNYQDTIKRCVKYYKH